MKMSPEELARRFDEADRVMTQLRQRTRERIVFDPELESTCVRSVGVPVSTIVQLVAEEHSWAQLVTSMPGLAVEDIRAALLFAAVAAELHCEPTCSGNGPGAHT